MSWSKNRKTSNRPLPRSILSTLHEPLLDPRDGHGARSRRDVLILQKWEAAKKGDDKALAYLVMLIVNENLAELKAARGTRQFLSTGGGQLKIRTLVPVMELLGMITVETVKVAPETDGYAILTSRKRIHLEDWFEDYALGRGGVDSKAVEGVRQWMANGSIQRRDFGRDWCD